MEKNVPVYEFSLRDALERGILVPYDYYVHPVELNAEEIEEWEDLSRQIGPLSARSKTDDQARQRREMLLIKRRKILDTAEGKVPALKVALLKDHDINHTLIYATDKDPGQLDDINTLLRELDIPAHQITETETKNPNLVRQLREQFDKSFLSANSPFAALAREFAREYGQDEQLQPRAAAGGSGS